jgi:hypothetical protein
MLGGVPALADTKLSSFELEPILIWLPYQMGLGIRVFNSTYSSVELEPLLILFLKLNWKKMDTRTGINQMLPPVWSQFNKSQTETRSDFRNPNPKLEPKNFLL